MGAVNWTPAQRDAIFSRGCSVAVSAAAGSGKTAVLTRRIIERVCAPDGSGDLSRILVVTFTKAAASELVSRISDALAGELAEHPENRHIRAQSLLVSSAHISTIHSFCLDIIRTNFQKLDIPADFSAADETEITLMMKEIMEELISDYFEGDGASDVAGEGNIPDFAAFADTFGDVSRTDKLADTAISLYQSLSATLNFLDQIDAWRDDYLFAAENGFDGSGWERVIREYLAGFLRHYEKIYDGALRYLAEHDVFAKYSEAFSADADFIADLLSRMDSGASYRELAERLASYSPTRLAVIRGAPADSKISFFKAARSDFSKEVREIAADYYSYTDAALEAALRGTADMLSSLSCFLRAFEKRFAAEKKRRRVITFGDMERYALALLWDRETDSPTALACTLRDSFDEIYIDEYQDTNEIQDKIFSLISREDNRFNVGDIKQSIYSFRGAEPSIFSALLDSRPKYDAARADKAVKIFLSENFRSTAEVLDFCNGVFETLMNADAERYGADERLNCGSGRHADVPEIVLVPKPEKAMDGEDVAEENPASEADFVAGRIAEYLSGGVKADGSAVKPSDIVILLRSASTSSAVYEDALKRRGIPCRNGAILEFFESPEVLLMISLLSVIDNPARDIYLAAALKSPLYGVTLDELLYIRRFSPNGSLFEALCRFTEETGFAKGGKFLRDRQTYAAMAAETPCDKLIWQIYMDTGIFSILSSDRERPVYETEQARANLVSLYDYARSFERGGFRGLSGFIAFINDVLENKEKMDISQFSAPGEVVNIMTIHKSKGLEFPICFVAATARRLNFPEAREKTVYNGTLGISVKLSAEGGLVRMDTPMRMAALLDLRRRAVDEELRVLYVALTRAKEKLIVTGTVDAKGIENGIFDLDSGESEYALNHRFFSGYALHHAQSYLSLILTAVAGNPALCKLVFPSGSGIVEQAVHASSPDVIEQPDEMTYYEAKKIVSERLTFEYPYRRLAGIPSKLSVSKLYPGILDETERDGVKDEGDVEIPKVTALPHFLMQEPDADVTAAERGTAMHTFMQFCDFDLVCRGGVAAEIDRLVENRFIFTSDKEKMDVGKLEAFFESTLAADIMASDRLYREKRFMIRYPASLFSEEQDDALAEETLLVQGVIDCAFFDRAGQLILVDYKTDAFDGGASRSYIEKTLRARHSRQLGYYKLACETLFGCVPAHTYIYSFALDGTVEIF